MQVNCRGDRKLEAREWMRCWSDGFNSHVNGLGFAPPYTDPSSVAAFRHGYEDAVRLTTAAPTRAESGGRNLGWATAVG